MSANTQILWTYIYIYNMYIYIYYVYIYIYYVCVYYIHKSKPASIRTYSSSKTFRVPTFLRHLSAVFRISPGSLSWWLPFLNVFTVDSGLSYISMLMYVHDCPWISGWFDQLYYNVLYIIVIWWTKSPPTNSDHLLFCLQMISTE